MSYEPVSSGDLMSHIDKFAPNTSSIDEFKAEEFPSSDPGILAEFQGGNKGTSTAGGVEGMSREDIVKEDDVVWHDLLVCQPCDEDEDVVAERKTNRRSDDESWDGDGNGEEDYDEEDEEDALCVEVACVETHVAAAPHRRGAGSKGLAFGESQEMQLRTDFPGDDSLERAIAIARHNRDAGGCS